MTLQEFYTELDKTKGLLDWTVRQSDGAIRGFGRGKDVKMFCPLTAVVYFSKEFFLETWCGFSATAELKMAPDDSSAIILASDNSPAHANVRQTIEEILFGSS